MLKIFDKKLHKTGSLNISIFFYENIISMIFGGRNIRSRKTNEKALKIILALMH